MLANETPWTNCKNGVENLKNFADRRWREF